MPLLHQVLLDLISSSKNLPESFTIADFGCSSRPHPLRTVTEITSFIYKRGRTTPDPSSDETCLLWDYLGQAFQDLIEKGLIEEEKLDTYNIPYYEPYTEEIKAEIEKQGSFMVDHLVLNSITTAQMIGNATRADHETTIRSHFGSEIVDRLFQRFSEVIAANTKEVELIGFAVSVTRK
ncbi:hypothetical protein QYF36_024766 [Acer negundo]|nr:hypothetical protein QYF36_024766 [Acer negundo]